MHEAVETPSVGLPYKTIKTNEEKKLIYKNIEVELLHSAYSYRGK